MLHLSTSPPHPNLRPLVVILLSPDMCLSSIVFCPVRSNPCSRHSDTSPFHHHHHYHLMCPPFCIPSPYCSPYCSRRRALGSVHSTTEWQKPFRIAHFRQPSHFPESMTTTISPPRRSQGACEPEAVGGPPRASSAHDPQSQVVSFNLQPWFTIPRSSGTPPDARAGGTRARH